MSRPNGLSADHKETASREAGSTAHGLSLAEASQPDFDCAFPAHHEPDRECPVESRSCSHRKCKNAFFAAVALLFVAVVAYAALDVRRLKRRAPSAFKKSRDWRPSRPSWRSSSKDSPSSKGL